MIHPPSPPGLCLCCWLCPMPCLPDYLVDSLSCQGHRKCAFQLEVHPCPCFSHIPCPKLEGSMLGKKPRPQPELEGRQSRGEPKARRGPQQSREGAWTHVHGAGQRQSLQKLQRERGSWAQRLRGAVGPGCPLLLPFPVRGKLRPRDGLGSGPWGVVRGCRGGASLPGHSPAQATPLRVPTPGLPRSTHPHHPHPRGRWQFTDSAPALGPIRRGASTARDLALLLAVAIGTRVPRLRRPPRPKHPLPA